MAASFPEFELVGDRCADPCRGVFIDTVNTRTQEFFQRCSDCGKERGRMKIQDKLAWVERAISRVLKGEQVS